jgi:peptide/nickel transport system substrate-binding protein
MHDIMGCRDDPKDVNHGEANLGGYCNREFDKLTDEVLQETDTSKRNLLIKQAFEIAMKDYAYIPLHQQAPPGVSRRS